VFDLLDSGVWAPTRCAREASAAGSSEADQSDSLVGGFARCAATLSELGLPGMRMDILLEMIASLPFEASMTYLGPLAAGLHHARHETRLHLRLAEQVFGQGPMLDVIRRFVIAGPDRLVFDERYLTALQRLLVEHAQADTGVSITTRERAELLTCLLAMGDVLPDWSPPEPWQRGSERADLRRPSLRS
jgi:hypothetical protein